MRENIFKTLFDESVRLDEFTVKDIRKIISPTDLPHRDYEPLLRQVEYQGTQKNICKWLVNNELNGWNVYIRYVDFFEQLQDTSLKASEVAYLLNTSSPIQTFCGCPAYKYWGMAYIQTQLEMAIVPENRFPHVRNPELKGLCCKHQRKLLKVLPFQTSYIAQAVKSQRDALGIKYTRK